MKELFDFAVELAERAGENILKYYRNSIQVDTKPDDSPVTIADRTTEELIRNEIEKRFPDDGILGEEFGEKPGRSPFRWILDPIDGTKTFIRGVPFYGTLIAVEREGKSVIGVIRFPAMKETLAAMTGFGCFVNGDRCRVSGTATVASAAVMTTAFNDFLAARGEKPLLRLLRETALQRTWADCYGYLLVAAGRVDAAFDTNAKIWDVAPLIPIIQEAGGRITSLDGESTLAITSMLATNGLIHDALMQLLQG